MRERQGLEDGINGVRTLERQLSDNIELIELGEEEGLRAVTERGDAVACVALPVQAARLPPGLLARPRAAL